MSVQETTDGGYIVAGSTLSFGARSQEHDVYLLKTDRVGNLLWEKTFAGEGREFALSVQETTDGGYIVAGWTQSRVGGTGGLNFYLVKTDRVGDLRWQKTFGGEEDDKAFSVQETTDGGYIVAGETRSFGAGESDVYLVKTDRLGNLLWQETFGGREGDTAHSVQETTDGGYIVAGGTESSGAGGWDIYLVKLAPEESTQDLFLRGDCNADGNVDISDAVCILNWLFLGEAEPGCVAATNVDGAGAVNITDPIYLLTRLFLGGPPPVEPFPDCGTSDLKADAALGCVETACP